MFGKIPVATAMFVNAWNPTRAAIPVQRSFPVRSLVLPAIRRHSNTKRRYRTSTSMQPTKPISSPITAKIKSVCSSDKKFPFFTEMAVSLSRPFPYSIPDPMAIFELSCWTFRSAYFPGLTKARIRFTWYPVRNGTAPRSARNTVRASPGITTAAAPTIHL